MRKEEGFFIIDGASVEYRAVGPAGGESPTLILLHEGLGCVSLWKDFPEQLAQETGCGVLAYSRIGYGRSTSCPLPRPLSFMHTEGLAILPRILDAAGVQDVFLIGHSDGASIALINAGGLGDERVKGLALMAPHVFVEDVTIAGIQAARVSFEEGGLRKSLARYHGENVDCAFLGWNRAWLDPHFRKWNLEIFLPDIRVPVLLIQGEGDNYGTARQLETIVQQVPKGADILMLPDCGHSPFRDQPEATVQAIAEFVSKHLPG
jgi:pimeloyl-ACP methyl ester carboxylesterase